jgi:hypothetical protein
MWAGVPGAYLDRDYSAGYPYLQGAFDRGAEETSSVDGNEGRGRDRTRMKRIERINTDQICQGLVECTWLIA